MLHYYDLILMERLTRHSTLQINTSMVIKEISCKGVCLTGSGKPFQTFRPERERALSTLSSHCSLRSIKSVCWTQRARRYNWVQFRKIRGAELLRDLKERKCLIKFVISQWRKIKVWGKFIINMLHILYFYLQHKIQILPPNVCHFVFKMVKMNPLPFPFPFQILASCTTNHIIYLPGE